MSHQLILYNLISKESLQGGEKFTFTEEERRQRQLDAYRRFHQSPKGKIATYNWNNCEQGKKRFKTYRIKHRELIRQKTAERCSNQNYIIQKDWNKNNPERVLEIAKKYRESPKGQEYIKSLLNNEDYLEKMRQYHKKWSLTPSGIESRRKRSQIQLQKLASKINLHPEELRIGLLNWSTLVRIRDKFECVVCGSTIKVIAHHIFYKIFYPKLALNKNNGISLCKKCHDELHYLKVGK